MLNLNPDLNCDPNIKYEKLEEKKMCNAKEKHIPVKTVKFNKIYISTNIPLGLLMASLNPSNSVTVFTKNLNVRLRTISNILQLSKILKYTTRY